MTWLLSTGGHLLKNWSGKLVLLPELWTGSEAIVYQFLDCCVSAYCLISIYFTLFDKTFLVCWDDTFQISYYVIVPCFFASTNNMWTVVSLAVLLKQLFLTGVMKTSPEAGDLISGHLFHNYKEGLWTPSFS